MSFVYLSDSPERTEELGAALGEAAEPGLVAALQGDLGAGKTLFTKGIARGLGVARPEYVTSPTFTLHKIHEGRLTLHHLDFYRFDPGADLDVLGLEEILGGAGICVIEWPDHFFPALGTDFLLVKFESAGESARRITVSWHGERAARAGAKLRTAVFHEEENRDP